MDFSWTDEELAFRKELRQFLDELIPEGYDAGSPPECRMQVMRARK